MTMLQHGTRTVAAVGKKHAIALLIITVMAMLTISTDATGLLGLPRPLLACMVIVPFILYKIKGRIGFRYIQFSFAYLAAFLPGVFFHLGTSYIKWTSVIQLVAVLITFCALASYFEFWLQRNSDPVKIKWLERILIYFFIISIIEICFYTQFFDLRVKIYGSNDVLGMFGMQRELSVYGGRPTALFSEASNYAKFVSVLVAAYMVVTRCSRRALIAFVVFFLLSRSVSYLYAAPVMLFAFLGARSGKAKKGRSRLSAVRVMGLAVIAILLGVGIFVTQYDRITQGAAGQDTSMNARLMYPLKYMLANPAMIITGYGITPQDDIQNFTLLMESIARNSQVDPMMHEGLSTTLITLEGMGLAGVAVFFLSMYLMRKREGAWMVLTFFIANVINAGYNSASTWVPNALVLSLLAYQFSLGKQEVRQLPSARTTRNMQVVAGAS
jgi:hypothetical protein